MDRKGDVKINHLQEIFDIQKFVKTKYGAIMSLKDIYVNKH